MCICVYIYIYIYVYQLAGRRQVSAGSDSEKEAWRPSAFLLYNIT